MLELPGLSPESQLELRLRIAAGDHRWFPSTVRGSSDAAGCLVPMTGSLSDITGDREHEAALDALRVAVVAERRFDVAGLDYLMPGMDGEQSARTIRADRDLARLAGFDACQTKPLLPRELRQILGRWAPLPSTIAATLSGSIPPFHVVVAG